MKEERDIAQRTTVAGKERTDEDTDKAVKINREKKRNIRGRT